MTLLSLLLLTTPGWAAPDDPTPDSGAVDPLAPEPYATAVRLVERLFLDPSKVDGPAMLHAAADELAAEIDWLETQPDPTGVVLLHGDGTPLGRVEVHGMTDLPEALARLEAVVRASGYSAGDVDLQLAVLSGMANALDRYSRILADERLDRFEVRLTGTLVGIGASFDWSGDGKAGPPKLTVTTVSAGGPASMAGLQVGDEVLRIDGRSTVSMPIGELSDRVRGESGSPVALTVKRAGVEQVLTLTRAEVVVPNVTHAVLPGDVGYVYIDHVSQRTVENLRSALADLRAKGALEHGLVIDLRGNTGGSMKESANAADAFLTAGLLLRTVGRDGAKVQNLQAEMYAADDHTEPDIPLVVVVDDHTASGSEIMAGALLELDRAALIGTRTYGKGTVQKIYNLGPDVRFKLTVARYILANDRAISGVEPGGPDDGIVPDVTVGRIELDPAEVRYVGWDRAFDRSAWDRVVPEVHTGSGDEDLPVEIARRAVLQTTGTRRADVLGALGRAAEIARLEQNQRLADALEARSIDWSAAPASPAKAKLDADVSIRAVRGAGDTWTLSATVTNRATEDLNRLLVELSCDTVSYWDGLVVPVGHLLPGQTVTRSLQVDVPVGIDARVDEVGVKVRADARPVRDLGTSLLESGSSPEPVVRVTARLVPQPGETGPHGQPVSRAELTIENLSRSPIPGLEAKFGFPEVDAVELLDPDARIAELGGRSVQTVRLAMEVGPGAPATLPLQLALDSDRYGSLADWPLLLPLDGSTVHLAAPQIEVRPPDRTAPVGRYTLPVGVLDDGRVDHVVVTVNGRKVSWAPGGTARVDLTPTFDLVAGENRVQVRAVDDQGLSQVHTVSVHGLRSEPTESVDAGL